MSQRKSINERFWGKVSIAGENECWEWTASKFPHGYGSFNSGTFNTNRAHIISFIISGGILTKEKPCVLHHCDNPSCVNPKHLFAGSQKDNMHDMAIKGRHHLVTGENNSQAILTEHDVSIIRSLRGAYKNEDIGKIFGVCKSTISAIMRRETWNHV